jgi:hypothetical protein
MQLVYAYIRKVSFRTHSLWKALHKSGLLEQGDVGYGTRYTLPNVTDKAGVQVHSYLALDGVAPLLARIPLVSFFAVLPIGRVWSLRSLHSLLKGIDHHRKLRQVAQQLIEVAPVFASRVWHFHRILARLGKHRQDTSEQARYSRVSYAE